MTGTARYSSAAVPGSTPSSAMDVNLSCVVLQYTPGPTLLPPWYRVIAKSSFLLARGYDHGRRSTIGQMPDIPSGVCPILCGWMAEGAELRAAVGRTSGRGYSLKTIRVMSWEPPSGSAP